MNYDDFIQIKKLLAERDQLKKGIGLIREMTVKGTSLPDFETRLVFAEQKERGPNDSLYFPMHPFLRFMQPGHEITEPPVKEWKEVGMIILEDILLLHVATVLVDHWEKRIEEINQQIKSLGLDP